MRIIHLAFPLVCAAILGTAAPSLARDMPLHKHSADEVKAICAKVGGSFSQGKELYGCGTDCRGAPGTDCIVTCGADQNCTAQVIGARRPRTIESALKR
ncbi:MAG: hypothetical protein WC670_19910 [Pseudolabrys sp.]